MKSRTLTWVIPILLIALVIAVIFFQREDVQPKNGVVVASTIFPIFDIVSHVAGDNAEVLLIIPAGASPHTLDPSPSIARKIERAEKIFATGHGLDNWITDSLPDTKVVVLDKNIDLIQEEDGHDEDDDTRAEGINPHYWLSPKNTLTIVDSVALALTDLDPENADDYFAMAEEYKLQLEAKSSEWIEILSDLPQRNILTFHDAFPYFAEFFELNIVATIEPFPGKEPTPQYLVELKDIINEHNIQTLFLEPQIPETAIRQFAIDNGMTLGELDPLGGTPGRMSYIELMEYNVSQINGTVLR